MVIRIQSTQITDYDKNGKIDKTELDKYIRDVLRKDPTKEEIEIDGKIYANLEAYGNTQLDASKAAKSGEAQTPEAAKATKDLEALKPQMDALQKQIEELQKQGVNKEIIADKQKALQQMIEQANALIKNGAKAINMTAYNKAAGMKGGQMPMSGKAQIATGGQQAQAGQAGAKAQSAAGGYSPASWGAQTWGGSSGVPMFSTDSYMKTMAMETNIQSSWDAVNKNTNRGKQLMMLFFYFAKMAESGSMDSMYQFMKFITYIISKDKAKQQIEMGKKLIQLQELSRSWTNKLLNVSTDSSDPSASNELMKTMTIVKSETDAIATSQKLISQMMEEFAQVVETLTNTTKAALETAGRIKRTVSTMR
jgi:hypothetical protein